MIAFLFSRQGLIAIAVIAALGLTAWLLRTVYLAGQGSGQTEIITTINRDNENAGKSAEDWRDRYRRCVGTGGVYHFDTGSCDR